jgi:hypothetical protein
MSIGKRARRRVVRAVQRVGRRLARVGESRQDEWMLTGEVCGSVLVPGTIGAVGGVSVYSDWAAVSPDSDLRVSFSGGDLSETAVERLVEALAGMEDVVPADLPVDGRCVDVAALAPKVDEHGLRWYVNPHLWLEEGPEPRLVSDLPCEEDGGWTVDLSGPEEAWVVVRALRTNESWQCDVGDGDDASADHRRRALAKLIVRRG